jgi:hypothetical protein
MKFVAAWLLFAAMCAANPIVVLEGVRDVLMTDESVFLNVTLSSTNITGDFTFAQLAAGGPANKDVSVRILLPVYVLLDENAVADPKFEAMNSIYEPKIAVAGKTYEPREFALSGHRWVSFWRGAKFDLGAFAFVIPREGLSEIFRLHVTYTQPHMIARGVAYACYCPLRPVSKNPLYRNIDDSRFTLFAHAAEGVKLKRVSENKNVTSENSGSIVVHCINVEDVIINVKKA